MKNNVSHLGKPIKLGGMLKKTDKDQTKIYHEDTDLLKNYVNLILINTNLSTHPGLINEYVIKSSKKNIEETIKKVNEEVEKTNNQILINQLFDLRSRCLKVLNENS